jgi:ATP-dependent Zn protease
MGGLGNFGRSQAQHVDPAKIRVTFEDAAGIDETKAELSEIVDFLRNHERYGRERDARRDRCICGSRGVDSSRTASRPF